MYYVGKTMYYVENPKYYVGTSAYYAGLRRPGAVFSLAEIRSPVYGSRVAFFVRGETCEGNSGSFVRPSTPRPRCALARIGAERSYLRFVEQKIGRRTRKFGARWLFTGK